MSDYFKKRMEEMGLSKTGQSSSAASSSKTSTTNNTPAKSVSSNDYFTKRIKEMGLDRSEVNDDFINTFINEANSFLKSAQTGYGNWKAYSISPTLYAAQKKTAEDLSQRSFQIRQYLQKNKDSMDSAAYESLKNVLDGFDKASSQSIYSLYKSKEFYSQFGSQAEYDQYVFHKEDYSKKINLDLDAAEKEIAELEKKRDDFYWNHEYDATNHKERVAFDEALKEQDTLIAQKKQLLKDARHIQEGVKLSSVSKESDFRDFSKYSTTIDESDSWWKGRTEDTQYEWINNQNGFRDSYEKDMDTLNEVAAATSQSSFFVAPTESAYRKKGYDHLTKNEIAIYNYYYAKDGKEKAQEYLDSIQEALNYRKATAMYGELEDQTALEMVFGVRAGLDQFTSGIRNFINTEDDYIPQSAVQMTSGMVREDLADAGVKLPDWMGGASLGQVGYDAITTSANMAPSILTSMAVGMLNPVAGKVAGNALMGMSAAGNAYQEALNEGYDKDQARGYGLLVGASEIVMEKVLGGISSLGGGNVVGKALISNLDNADTALKMIAKKLGSSALSEFSEEYLQEVLTPVFKNLTLGTHEDVKLLSAEALYSGILGALTAGFLEGPTAIAGEVKVNSTGKQLQEAGISAQRLADIGKTFAADTVAFKLAGKVDENTGAYTMGRLFNEIGATLTEQNQTDIANALTKEGMPVDIAKKQAKTMARIVDGSTMTDAFIHAMDDDKFLAKAVKTTIIDSNATWFQRTKGYNEALMALAQEKASPKASRTEQSLPGQEKATASDKVDTNNKSTSEAGSEADVTSQKFKIAAIKDGQVTVKFEDDSEMDATEAGLDPEDGVIVETIAKIGGISSEDANYILNTLKADPGVNPQVSALGAREAYMYGFYGMSDAHMTEHGVFSNSLNKTQRDMIYAAGRNARQTQVDAKQAAVAKNATTTQVDNKNATDAKKVGKVHFDGDRSRLTKRQSASLTAMEKIADVMGVQVYVFESKVGANGKRIGANGWYDPRDNSVHIDLHAGANGEGTMLFTMAHELTHHIRKWSPAKFKVLSDFLMQEYGKQGVNVDGLIRKQMAKAKRNGRTISYDTAYEEVVADSMEMMLSDGNVMKRLEKLKAQDKDLWHEIKRFIDDMAAKIRSVYKGMTPDSEEGRYVAQMGKAVYRLQELFAEALYDASENYQASLTPGEEGVMVNQNGEPVAHATADGTVQLSMRTYEEEGREAFRKYLQKCVSSKKLTKAEMQEMLDGIEEIYGVCKEFKDKYAPFSAWSDAAVVRDTRGKPVFSVVTPNGDYKMNLDFSLVCKKRRTLDAVFNEMSRRGIIDDFELGQKSVVKINEIIRKYGLETACALCFVDAKRFRQASMADQFTSLYNELVESLVPEDQKGSIDHFNFAGYATIKKVEGGIDTWQNSKLDFSHINHVLKTYGDGTVEYKAAKYIKNNPQGRKLLLRGDFMSSQGFDAVKSQNQDILKLYNSKKGTGGPKAAFGDVQYMNEVIQKARWWTPAKAYAVGGIRIQSFSDYVPRMVFDYVQMIYDLAAAKLPAHAYTKEALFVKQFGLTGVKINMSLIPAIAEGGIAPGLDANGDYVWAGESFDFETAKEIQNAEGYTENCGTICVGVSYEHIRKLLSDPNIRMVIPYHKSGLNPIVAHMNKIAEFTDYTTLKTNPGGCQNTMDKNGSKVETDFNFNEVLRKTGDPKATVRQYLDWCAKKEYTPRFAEFAWHENYYKLIEDFTLYDKDGNYVPQREVRAVFPKVTDAFGSMKDLIQEGLQEDAVVEGRRDKNLSAIVDEIQRTIPKTEAEIAEDQVTQADRDLEAEVKYSVREAFYKEFDAWDKKDPNVRFITGTTSDVLKSVGMKDQDIVLRSGTVLQKIKTHPEMTLDIFTKIPELLEHPVIVQFSDAIDPKTKRPKYDSSITVLGELYADVKEGTETVKKPVLVSLELLPTNQKKTAVLDFAIIKSAYSKNALQQYLNENSILYIDPDKKRTDSWLSLNRLQLPLGEKRYGPIRKIAYVDGKVKVQSPKNMSDMQKKLFEAGIVDEFGNKLFSDRDTSPTFYSHMARVVDGVKQEKLGAASVVSMLRGKGVKAEEIKWSGIETFLEGKKSVTKAELQEFIAGSMLQIGEQTSGTSSFVDEDGNAYTETEFRNRAYEIADEQGIDHDRVKFILDGGEMYAYVGNVFSGEILSATGVNGAKWSEYKLDGGENYREIVFTLPNSTYSNQMMRIHWGDDAEGVLAHARVQDFNVNGKKMLFIEEIQSDWHNEGHKDGYADSKAEAKIDALKATADERFLDVEDYSMEMTGNAGEWETIEKTAKGAKLLRDYREAQDAYDNAMNEFVKKIPDAPFKDNYHEFVLKRLIREAAEKGYDSIGWTPSEIQVKRWSEEFAEGYRIEYDQDIPKFLNKYGKKWGAKVSTTKLNQGNNEVHSAEIERLRMDIASWRRDLAQAETASERSFIQSQIDYQKAELNSLINRGVEVWTMPITESMKESVLTEGQPLYSMRDSDGNQLSAEQQEFFKDSKVRDSKGNLIVLYHGTSVFDNITEFRTRAYKANRAVGLWLSDSHHLGALFASYMGDEYIDRNMETAEDSEIGNQKKGGVYKLYANLTNPLVVDALVTTEENFGGVVFKNYKQPFYHEIPTPEEMKEAGEKAATVSGEEIAIFARANGYDGVIIKNVKEGYGTAVTDVIAFEPNQVKYADNRTPTSGTDIRYSDRDSESVSNRSLLANALESAAQNDIERKRIQEYKGKIGLINAEERKLSELTQKIRDLSFSKGPKDTKAIRDLQFEAKQTANRINTYDKQLLRLEASKPLQEVLTREKKLAYQRAEKKGKEALAAYRERATKTQRELMDRYEQSRKWARENREKTAMRHKIKDVVNDLNQYLLKGTKDRHVPIGLQKAVAEALNAVNMDTVGAEERIAKLQAEMMKAKTPEAVQEISKKIDHIREMGDNMSGKLKRLKEAYDDFLNSDDPLIANSHDDGLSAHMMTLIVRVGDTPLRDMSLSQLQDVYDVYKIVLATVRNANKSFKDNKNREISTRANQVMAEIDNLGIKRGKRLPFMDWVEKFGWDNLKPVYAMEHIGSKGLIDAFNNVRAGEDVWATDVTEAREYYLEKFRKYRYDSWDFEKKSRFTSTTGKDFELTLYQIMSLYAYSKRDQAEDHLKYGGIVFDPKTEVVEKTKSGLKVKYNVANATAYNISAETLADIISKLTPEQKGFVDEMQAYLSDVMGAKGNEVSLAMYDVKLFREKHYFPLKSAHQYMAKAKEQAQGDVKIKNSGFSKETKPHAKNPIVLSSFMDVWSNHVNEMSMYHAFVLPMEDFYRIYNYTTPSKNENMPTEGVNAYIENAYGSGATGYIEQMLKDLNGGARTDSRTGFINKMMGKFKKGAVFASLSVVVQQPSAIARAAALVDTKYFIGPKVDHKRHKLLWDEVKQYAPVAIIKEMGYFDTNMGKSTQDFILGKEYSGFKEKMKALVTDSGYRDEVLSKAPALADELAWCSIWEAVKRETQAKNPGMKVSSEEFLNKAGQRFTEVITKTQVYDSVLARSANMRSKDTGMKMATAFMAEPTTSINMVADALLQGKRGDKKYARAAMGAVIASNILNSILVSFVYAGRDDDEDETYWEKYIGTLSGEILDSLNPAGYIPFIKDIMSIVQGYDVERSDMAVISDLWKAIENLKNDKVSPYRKVEGFVGSICQIFGLPVKNIMRDVRGIYQTVMSFVNGQQTTKAGIGHAVKGAITGETATDKQQLYEAILSGDQAHIDRVKGRFKDQSAINSAIRKALRENDPRIRQAAIAWNANDLDEYMRIAKQIIGEKHFVQDDVVLAIRAEANELTADDGTTSTSKAKGLFTAEKFAEAISQGDQAMANAVKTDIIQTEQKNGKTADEAEKSFNSSAKTQLKEMYLEGSISDSKAINALVSFCGMEQEDAEEYVSEWAFQSEYGFTWSDRGDAYISGKISESELRTILMDVGGKTEEEADLQIQVYDWEADGYEGATAAAVREYNEHCAADNVPKDVYLHIRQFSNNTENDVDMVTGKTIYYSAMKKVMAEIGMQTVLTRAQKYAIARSLGWSEKNIQKYKTW